MLYLFEFDFREGNESETHGFFKLLVDAVDLATAKDNAQQLIIEATENNDEFFESGTIIWLKSLKSMKNGTLAQGTIFDFIDASSPGISQTYPVDSVMEELNEGEEGNEVIAAEPFFVIP